MTRTDDHTPPLSDELLQRYHDDELSEAERAEVEARLDPDAIARLEALDELGGLLRQHAAREAEDALVSTALAPTIAAIERSAGPPGGGAGAPRAVAAPRRGRTISIFASLAAAAALALALWPGRPAVIGAAQVEQLEVSGSVATVFNIEDGDQAATVIWAALDDDDDDDDEVLEGPAAPEDESEAL